MLVDKAGKKLDSKKSREDLYVIFNPWNKGSCISNSLFLILTKFFDVFIDHKNRAAFSILFEMINSMNDVK